MTVGDRIRNERERQGLTLEELAKKMGYSGKTSVYQIENKGDAVTLRTVSKFAEALGVTESILMGWEENAVQGEKDMFLGLIEKLNASNKEHLAKYLYYLINEQEKDD